MTPQEHAAAVDRHDLVGEHEQARMMPVTDGDYVLFDDYRKILDRLAVAEAERDRAKQVERDIFNELGSGVGWYTAAERVKSLVENMQIYRQQRNETADQLSASEKRAEAAEKVCRGLIAVSDGIETGDDESAMRDVWCDWTTWYETQQRGGAG